MKSNNVHGFELQPVGPRDVLRRRLHDRRNRLHRQRELIAGNGTGHVSLVGFNGSATLKDLTMSGTAFDPDPAPRQDAERASGNRGVPERRGVRSHPASGGLHPGLHEPGEPVVHGLNLSGMSSSNAPGGFFSNGGMILDHTGPSVPLGNTIFPCQGRRLCRPRHGQLGRRERRLHDGVRRRDDARSEGSLRSRRGRAAGLGDVTFNDAYASVPPVGGTVCEGSPFTFTVTAGGVGPFTLPVASRAGSRSSERCRRAT